MEEQDGIELNLKDIVQFFKEHYQKMILFGIIASIVGALYSLALQNEYQAKAQLLPEIHSNASSALGGLGALAGLAGISMPSGSAGTDAVRPDLYPNILQSVEFSLYLLKQPVYVYELKKKIVLADYLKKKNESWLVSFFDTDTPKQLSLLDPKKYSNAIELTKQEQSLVKQLGTRITSSMDRKSGIITINTEMPDAVVAASVANLSVEYLRKYVVNYKTSKAKQQLEFLEGQMVESKRRLKNAEMAIASFKDRNRFLELQTAIVSEQRLTADFMLAQKIYDGFVQQYEQAKVKIQEETPVVKILDPVQIPLQKSSPKRTIITLVAGILGVIVCVGWLLGRKTISGLVS